MDIHLFAMVRFLKVFVFLNVLVYSYGEQDVIEKLSRHKRNLIQFGLMINSVTDRYAWNYAFYGCWCGSGGSGPVLEGVDACCHHHDKCYEKAIKAGCTWTKSPYFVLYDVTYDPDVVCNDQDGTCDKMACECDRLAVDCFHKQQYHPGLNSYVNKNCAPCTGYGDVRNIKTTGAKMATAKKEGFSVTGLRASYHIVDQDISALQENRECYVHVAQEYGIHPALIAALASRVSRAGGNLTSAGYGVRDPNKYGIMQCDTKSPLLGTRCQNYGPKSCGHIEMMIEEKLVPDIRQAMTYYTILHSNRRSKAQRDAIAAYEHTITEVQSWSSPDSKTNGGDFSSDVVARAHRLILHHKWTCDGTSPHLDGTTPHVPDHGVDNCKKRAERGDCDFYLECVEKHLTCDNEGYAVGYGYRYCNRFALFYEDFTSEGKKWINAVRICLMKALLPYMSQGGSQMQTCKQIMDIAFDSHVECYVHSGPGICSVALHNKKNLWNVFEVKRDFFGKNAKAAWKQVLGTLWFCSVELYKDTKEYLKGILQKIFAWSRESRYKRDAIYRQKRSTECEQYVQSGDCRFYECFEDKFACAEHEGYSHIRDFELTSCMKFSDLSLSNSRVSAWMTSTQQCLMDHLMTLYNQDSLDCEMVELHMLEARVSCMVDAGFCSLDSTAEWMIERATDRKGYPYIAPKGYTTLPESRKTIQIDEYYYQTLPWFKMQIASANKECFERGERNNKDLYQYVDSAKYGRLKVRTEL